MARPYPDNEPLPGDDPGLRSALSGIYNGARELASRLTPRNFKPRADRLRYIVDKVDLAKREVKDLPAPTDRPYQATLISSKLENGKHQILLDLDGIGAKLVPSSTEGNFHLYIEDGKDLSWREYKAFLRAARDAGLITGAYYAHSVRRKATLVRPPGVFKLWNESRLLDGTYSEDDDFVIPDNEW